MMNEILWNLINTEEVENLIDTVIVRTKEEEEHDEVVEKVVKRLAENDSYVKPEKFKWKVKKVGFLEVVIGLERFKIEEERMKALVGKLTANEVLEKL